MIVTMLVVLMITGTGAYAMFNTNYEIRGSGFVRSAAQAQYVSETGAYGAMEWLDRVGPMNLMNVISRTSVLNAGQPIDFLAFNEPRLVPGQLVHRLFTQDLNMDVVPTISREHTGPSLLLPTHPAMVIVDLTDIRRMTLPMAGSRSDGGTGLARMSMAVTSRGRLRRTAGANVQDDEVASDTRAYIVSVPYQP